MAGTEGPLAGVTVVDLTRILAGPWCTLRLACVPSAAPAGTHHPTLFSVRVRVLA